MKTAGFFEALGIDLIPYAIGSSKFESNPPFEPTKLTEIRDQVKALNGKKLDEALEYSKKLFAEEDERGGKIESKAFNLIGVTGISAAFVTGISSLFPKDAQITFPFPVVILLIFYIFIVIALTLTILLASRVVIVGAYKYSFPDASDVFRMNTQTLIETKKDRLASYLYCYSRNSQIHNIKASYLIGAQLWFRNSVVLFLILAFALIPNFFGNIASNFQRHVVATATPTVTLTETLVPSTITPTPNSVILLVSETPSYFYFNNTPITTASPPQ